MAERGAELLERKLRILRAELTHLARIEQNTREAWEEASCAAQTWAERTVLLGGQRAVRLAANPTPATVTISFTTSMGVQYPAQTGCTLAAQTRQAPMSENGALVVATDRHVRALDAAVQHATASAAVRIVEAEQLATRLRLRAIRNRWIPRLERAISDLVLLLEESERAEAVRLRWSAER